MKALIVLTVTVPALLVLGLITGVFRRIIERYQDWRLKAAFRRLARELAHRLAREEDEPCARKAGDEKEEDADWNWDGAGLSSFELEELDRDEQEQFYALASQSLVAYAAHLAQRLGPDDGDSSRKPVEV